MKFNWGYRVALLYIGFAGLILYLVTRSMKEDVDLVATDYYAQELKYQDKKESEERNNNLSNPAAIYCDETGIRIEFPTEFVADSISGTIQVFRPSDKSRDFTVDVACNQNHVQTIERTAVEKGMYRVKLSFAYAGNNYYSEKQIVVRD